MHAETPNRQDSKVNIYSNGYRQWQAVVGTITEKGTTSKNYTGHQNSLTNWFHDWILNKLSKTQTPCPISSSFN